TSASRSSICGKFRCNEPTVACDASIVELVVSEPPSCATSSAICSALREAVPSSIIPAVKLASPGLSLGLAPLPVLTTSCAETIGRAGRSLDSTLRPVGHLEDDG